MRTTKEFYDDYAKKLLLISKYYPPNEGSRSQRVYYFSYYLSKMGWNIDVLTEKKDEKIPDEFNTDEIRIIEYAKGWWISQLKKGEKKRFKKRNEDIVYINKLGRLLDKYSLIDRYFYQIPTIVIKALKLCKKEKYNAIVSFSLPASMLVSGFLVSQIINLPLIIEFGDPWTLSVMYNKPKLYEHVERRIEKTYLKKAEIILTTTQQQKELYEHFIGERGKCYAILSGYDPKLYKNNLNLDDSEFNISHIGNIYGERTPVDNLLKSCSDLISNQEQIKDHLKITLFGSINKQMEIPENIKNNLYYGGRVDFIKSLREMQKSTILLLLGNIGGLQIPGKVFWYIGAKRHILTILGDENDPLKAMMTKLNRGPVVNNNKDEIKEAIETLYDLWKKDKLDEKYDLSDIPEFYWENRVKKVNKILNKILTETSGRSEYQ